MERLTDEEFETIKKLALETAQVTTMSQRSMYEAIKSLCSLMLDGKKLAAYENIGTPEQFAAWKKAEEEGRIAPCNWGDKIYGITGRFANRIIKEYTVSHSTLFSDEIKITTQRGESFIYGRSAFGSQEAAQAALEAKEGERI